MLPGSLILIGDPIILTLPESYFLHAADFLCSMKGLDGATG